MSVDLTTRYLGLTLKNPVVVAACSIAGRLDVVRRMEDAGASAIVLPSLFEEQIEHEEMAIQRFYERGTESFAEAIDYFPELDDRSSTSELYLDHVAACKSAVSVPIIGSLNGVSPGGWVRYAKMIQDAGADALELNVYFVATDAEETSAQVEARYLNLVTEVRRSVTLPLAVKVGPFFSSLPNMAKRLVESGANGLVLFNRFLQPDIDLETLNVGPHLVLSTSDELRLPLRWMAILRPQLKCSLAATTGVHTASDVLKLLLAGADVAMVASSLYAHGPGHIRNLVEGVNAWLEEREYESVTQMKGSISQENARDPSAFERANYIKTLVNYTGADSIT